MQGGYTSAATGYGGYAFPGYGSPGPAGYPAPQAYPRGPTHEGDDGPGSPTMATSHGYSAGTPASASAGYDAYGRGQQYPAYASNAIAGYGLFLGYYSSNVFHTVDQAAPTACTGQLLLLEVETQPKMDMKDSMEHIDRADPRRVEWREDSSPTRSILSNYTFVT